MESSLVYSRAITSGLGDRFGNYLCVAAIAKALDMDCHIHWVNDEKASGRTYSFDLIRRYIRFPQNVVVHHDATHTRNSILNGRAANLPGRFIEIVHSGNELPATNAYDCVYTLAHRALSVPGHTVDGPAMESAFRAVAREWTVIADRAIARKTPYVVLHLRGGDKSTSPKLLHREFATEQLLRAMPRTIDVVVMTDDFELLQHHTSQFPFLKYHSHDPGAEDRDFADMITLMNAKAIIQHSSAGWSAFSSVIAMSRQIPLINTYIGGDQNLLLDFQDLGGRPVELRSAADVDGIERFVSALAAGAEN